MMLNKEEYYRHFSSKYPINASVTNPESPTGVVDIVRVPEVTITNSVSLELALAVT